MRGVWTGKVGSHEPRHAFGELGRLPHLQLNMWRIGVKGSGIAFRVPLVPPRVLLARVAASPSSSIAR